MRGVRAASPRRYGRRVATYPAVDGAGLTYDAHGPADAPVVIALPGGPARDPAYLGDLAGLAGARRLVVPHPRGVGRSPLDPAHASWWAQAGDVQDLRLHLGASRVVLLAHSAAARQAVSHALRFPGLAGLVLVTPSAASLVDVTSDAEAVAARRATDPVFRAAVAALEGGADTSSAQAYTAWQHAGAPAGYAAWGTAERAHAAAGRWHLAAARAYLAGPPPDDLRAALPTLTVPTLVVAGAEDALTGVTAPAALAAALPAGRLVVLEACGHYPWVEQPAAFRAVVDRFLAEVLPG